MPNPPPREETTAFGHPTADTGYQTKIAVGRIFLRGRAAARETVTQLTLARGSRRRTLARCNADHTRCLSLAGRRAQLPPVTIERLELTAADRAEARTVLVRKGASPPAARNFKRGVLGLVLFVGLAVMLIMLLGKENPRGVRGVFPRAGILAGCAAYAAGVLAIVVGARLVRRLTEAAEARLPPEAYRFTEVGLVMTRGARSRTTYWKMFHSLAETENLFVVRERPDLGHIFPKRQFPDAAAVDATRQLLAEKLAVPAKGEWRR
jgi:hypothetical protein